MGLLAAKGTTVSIGGSISKVRSVKYSDDDNAVDVTGLEDSDHVFAGGIPKKELTITVYGAALAIARGSTSTITIVWGGTTSDNCGGLTYRCTKKDKGADVDGVQTVDLTFVPDAG